MATDYKRLGALTSAGVIGTADTLYACGVESSVVSTVAVTNRAATSANYRVAVSTATTFEDAGYLVYEATVPANDTIFLTLGATLDGTNKYLLCSASATTVSFSAFGMEYSVPVVLLPTGGTITESGGYRIHTFATSGTFESFESLTVEYLIVGGGGGGGYGAGAAVYIGGAGGGAGGYVSSSELLSASSYGVVVGAGGARGTQSVAGENGGNSSFNSLTAIGGGRGGSHVGGYLASTGGSGGGSDVNVTDSPGAAGTVGQGNNGGPSRYLGGQIAGGSGGGAGGAGIKAPGLTTVATGGAGSTWLDGVIYSIGGNGGARGHGTVSTKTVNRGHGGDAGGGDNNPALGSSGSSGIVIIRYPIA